MDAKGERVRADLRRYRPICLGSSGSDHIHADRIALLLVLTALWRAVCGPRHRRGLPLRRASPAGLDGQRTLKHRSIRHCPIWSI